MKVKKMAFMGLFAALLVIATVALRFPVPTFLIFTSI